MEILNVDSGIQKIVLRKEPGAMGLSLWLDGALQFRQRAEYRYHECLGVMPMLFCKAERILICGGGDGLLAERLLRYDSVKEIVLCDYDPMITEIAASQPDLVTLNRGSMRDERMTILNEDAFGFLEKTDLTFDLIICDFPDPWFVVLGRLYSAEFYTIAKNRLSKGGVLITQTCMDRTMAPVIRNTVRSVFKHEMFFSNFSLDFALTGFTFGSDKPFKRINKVPDWTRYLTEELVDSLFFQAKDDLDHYEKSAGLVSTVKNNAIAELGVLSRIRSTADLIFKYRYNADYDVFIVDKILRDFSDEELEMSVRAMDRKGPTIFYLDEVRNAKYAAMLVELGYAKVKEYDKVRFQPTPRNMETVLRYGRKLGADNSIRLEQRYTRPADDADVRKLMAQYLESYSDRLFDIQYSQDDADRLATYVIGSSDEHGSFFLVKYTDAERQRHTIDVEVIFSNQDMRTNVAAILEYAKFLEREEAAGIHFFSPDPNINSITVKLGGEVADVYSVYARETPVEST